jgi:hypothetical protein
MKVKNGLKEKAVRWEQMQVGLKVADWSDLMMVGELV